ncbi:MAG: AAA family ATPase [Cellvibrionaceae bacterium]|nr:AAA family ATPase [Cellvibrionaceae bacterium]MCV6627103.1 AAA family ATPase [Cellvibrionaceae bacterium]
MGKLNPINNLTIQGFKSIEDLRKLRLDSLNILIGANGVGKSNFVSYFSMLSEMIAERLQVWTSKQGGADRVLSYGIKETNVFSSYVEFGINGYKFDLEPTVDGGFTFAREALFFDGPFYGKDWTELGAGHSEAKLKDKYEQGYNGGVADYCYSSISSWRVYHFHDTSITAGVKRLGELHDNKYLRSDASNLAAFLYSLKRDNKEAYDKIVKTIRLAIPFFDDFVLDPKKLASEEEQIRLLWKQKDSDYALWPSQLSDGSIRFICLVTALLQPKPPSTIIIDEPELGLHPYAISLLAGLLRSASKRMQVIVSTQSAPLVDEFSIDDLIVVEREKGATVFKRLSEDDFVNWLNDYTVSELWQKNILGGRPKK